MCGSEEQEAAYLQACDEEAIRVMELHWNVVEALAEELLRRETLIGDEGETIIRRHVPDR